jgi:hypothetical protein
VPSEPQPGGVLFDVQSLTWQNVTQDTEPTMDHRALVPLQDRWLTVGGMTSGQQVTHQVRAYRLLTTGE